MWAIDILHCLHTKCEMTYIISMLFPFVSSWCFLVLVYPSTVCTCIMIYTTTNMLVWIVIALEIKNSTTLLTTPFLKACDMWWTWWKSKCLQHNHSHHNHYHDNHLIISTIIIIIIMISKCPMNNCVKSIDMENIYPIYVDSFDDFTKIIWAVITKITSACLLHLSLTMISSLSFSCKPACYLNCLFLPVQHTKRTIWHLPESDIFSYIKNPHILAHAYAVAITLPYKNLQHV